MTGKGDKRRPGKGYEQGWGRIYVKPVECPACGEIELRPTGTGMSECANCGHEEQ